MEGVEIRMSLFSKEKCLITGIEGTKREVREVEGEEARDVDEERIIAVEEVEV